MNTIKAKVWGESWQDGRLPDEVKGKGKGKDGKDDDKGKGKGKGKDKGPHGNHYYIDGKIYDFSEWRYIHPGGSRFFDVAHQRDISAAVHAYHRDPEKLVPLLAKYETTIEEDNPRDILAKHMNAPVFILPPDFDAQRDVPTYDWDKGFMKSLRKKINTPEMVRKVRRADAAFEVVTYCIMALHFFVCFPALYLNIFPWWLWVVLQVTTRTALAGIGHYHCHRAKDDKADWAEGLFDIQYVGASCVLADGHVMLHHLYTETPADVKRTVFNYMVTLPRLYRIPIFTAQKFGEFFTGHLLRFGAHWDPMKPLLERLRKGNRLMRLYMNSELFWAALCGKLHWWFLQFCVTMWSSMFQIVSSHDFEVTREEQEYRNLDWGIFQVQHALDTYVTGIKHVDIFLTAGLGTHRAHHVLPYQKSGFANIASEPALRETCKEFGVEWAPARNLLLDRFFPLMFHYWTAPAQIPAAPRPILIGGQGIGGFIREHMQPELLVKALGDVCKGFTGASI
jgi:hypothetical protein